MDEAATGRMCVIGGGGVEPVRAGSGCGLVIIAGPCVIEDAGDQALRIGEAVASACRVAGLGFVFKASFDKANRSSLGSPRGPGLDGGLAVLARVRGALGVPVTTDVHEPAQASAVAEGVDLLQVPAFLCRQTDLLVACGEAADRRGRAVNVKKGQFVSPEEMRGPVQKVRSSIAGGGADRVMVTERGTFFGYHRLVNDFAGVGDLLGGAGEGAAVCFDCTHSVQTPGSGAVTGGRRERAALLARSAAAAGVDAVFLECHPDPDRALSDAATMLPLAEVGSLVGMLARVRDAIDGAERG